MNAAGKDVVSLGIGGPDGAPPAAAVNAAIESMQRQDSHSYQLASGIPELKEAYARFYRNHYGVNLDPATQVLPLIGSKEGIMHISLAFLNPGDKVLVPNPGYPTYAAVTRITGATPVFYNLTEENGWYPDFDTLEATDLSGVKLMWINYPHMPTGTPATKELFDKTIDFGRRHGILIVHDNPYSFILNDNPMSILQTPGALDTAIEMNSTSKSLNMAGWRMGVAVGKPEYITWVRKIKSNIDSGQFRPMMLGTAKALEADSSWFNELNKTYASRRKAAERIMTALECSFNPAQQGMFLWGRIPDRIPDVERFTDLILEKCRVFITPGSIFGSNGNRYIRISLCAPIHRLDEAYNRLISQPNLL